MKLNFCVACGATTNLEHHHLIPRVTEGPDDERNLVTLCETCHGKAHGLASGFKRGAEHGWPIGGDMRALQAAGIKRAKEAGKYRGTKKKEGDVISLADRGMTREAIAKQLNMSLTTVYRRLRERV